MPVNEKKGNLLGELVVCSRCKNPFMGKPIEGQELVCDNCIKLEERKKELELGVLDNVIESNKQMDKCINKMKDCLSVEEKQYSKQDYLNSIKKRAHTLTRSIDLLEKIDETQDEAYIEEYKKMFLEMRKEQNEKK